MLRWLRFAGYLLSMILAFILLLGKKQKVQVKIKGFICRKQKIRRIFAFGPAIFYYERPQFVYGDVRQSVSGGVF